MTKNPLWQLYWPSVLGHNACHQAQTEIIHKTTFNHNIIHYNAFEILIDTGAV